MFGLGLFLLLVLWRIGSYLLCVTIVPTERLLENVGERKEYIKCLENRVAVLENQNKTLIEELKSLKELYCQQKTE